MDEAAGGLRGALALLEALGSDEAVSQGGLGVSRLANVLRRDASQVSRTLRVLADAGYVERDQRTLRYRLGWEVFALAARALDQRLVAVAGPILRRLAAQDLGERTHLTVLRGPDVLTVLTEAPQHAVQSVSWAGRLVPAWNTSSGRSLLLDLDKTELSRLFAGMRFRGGGPNAPKNVEELHRRIVAARADGFVTVVEEFEEGLVAASAPIRDFRGDIVAALNVSGPAFRLGPRLAEAAAAVKAAADEIAHDLGWGAPSETAATDPVGRPA
ncbi:MAG TPA: IclR family transcriptional regulator [Candidatus Limnocylindrales bacterium]|nr:IclR family transcriptional regulator [Candidatus Limnocylindrales bacterium]